MTRDPAHIKQHVRHAAYSIRLSRHVTSHLRYALRFAGSESTDFSHRVTTHTSTSNSIALIDIWQACMWVVAS
jgi:hypothetical protein